MGIFNLFSKKNKRSSQDTGGFPDPTNPFWYETIDSMRRPAGQTVNATTAARIAAVFACQTAIKESIAMLPVTLVESQDTSREVLKDHHLYRLLHDQPNKWMDSFEFFETMQTQALDHGDSFAFIERTKSGKINSLVPLQSDKMIVRMSSTAPYELQYIYREGAVNRQYTQEDIFHFKPHTKDGLRGRTPIKVAADTVGFSLALLEHGNRLFENGAFIQGMLKFAGTFKTEEARENFVNSFKKYLTSQTSNGIALLESGGDFVQTSMNNKDAQFLEAKQFSVIEIARLFRMPPVMIQVTDQGMSFASVEQLNIMFVQYTIQPWATRWEKAVKRQLLRNAGEEDMSIKFNLTALLRGDLLNRTSAIVNALQYGLLTINEGRALEDRDPIKDPIGNEPLLSHNLRPAKEIKNDQKQGEKSKIEQPSENKIDEESARSLLQHTLGRIRRRELQVQKAGVKPGKTRTEWSKDFLSTHADLLWNDLTPVVRAFTSTYRAGLGAFISKYLNELELEMQSEDSFSTDNTERNARELWHLINGTENDERAAA